MIKCGLLVILKILLLSLFIIYYASITLFTHSHVIDGVTIVHSHYFKTDNSAKSSFPTHKHTTNQLTLISQLSLFQSLQLWIGSFLLIILFGKKFNLKVYRGFLNLKHFFTNLSLRAPPVI